MERNVPQNNSESLSLSFEFDAPAELVFRALSEPRMLEQWWGPAGYTMTVVSMDFKPGGLCLFKMENADSCMWARFVYKTIRQPERLEFILSFSDEDGGVTRAPFFGSWPLEIMNVIRLSEKGGKTMIHHTASPFNASAEEFGSFSEHADSFKGGSTAAWLKLATLLK